MEVGKFIATFCVVLILIFLFLSLVGGSKGTANTYFLVNGLTALGGVLMTICTALLGR